MQKIFAFFFISLILCTGIFFTGCVAPPKGDVRPTPTPTVQPGQAPGQAGETGTSAPGETPVPTETPVSIITIETPYVSQSSIPSPVENQTAGATPAPDRYVDVYHEILNPRYNTTAISLNLTNPPLILNYSLDPRMVTDEKWFVSRNTSRAETEVTLTMPSQTSWFRITIYDKNTREVIDQKGYGREYSSSITTGQMKVFKSGIYLIEMEGNDVTAAVNISVKERGNIIPF